MTVDCESEESRDTSCFFNKLPLKFVSKFDYPFDGYKSNYPEAFHTSTLNSTAQDSLKNFTITQDNYNNKLYRSRTYYKILAQRKDSDEKLKLLYAADPDLQPSFELIRPNHEKFDDRCLENNVVDCANLCHEANGILMIVEDGKFCAHYEVGSSDGQSDLLSGGFLYAENNRRLLQRWSDDTLRADQNQSKVLAELNS